MWQRIWRVYGQSVFAESELVHGTDSTVHDSFEECECGRIEDVLEGMHISMEKKKLQDNIREHNLFPSLISPSLIVELQNYFKSLRSSRSNAQAEWRTK
jgi:hypothetical protein